MREYHDVCIIGGGVVGTAIARELSRYDVSVTLLEQGDDVSVGATKANSGIVHGGYTAKHGTLKGELSIDGNRRFDELADTLGFPFRRNGSLVLAFSEEEKRRLEELIENGRKNGVEELEIIDRNELERIEPEVGPQARSALLCRETGTVSPYEFCIALAENAVANGLDLRVKSEAVAIERQGGHFRIDAVGPDSSSPYELFADFVVNAAGVNSDKVAALAGDASIDIHPRQGQYLIFQRGTGKLASHVIFQAPTKHGKGVLVTSTVWGNLMVGPNSEEIPDRYDTGTNEEIIRYIVSTARKSIPNFDLLKVIRSFSGVRATEAGKDFVIGPSSSAPGLLHAAGIDSPGLTSAPAIAERISGHLEQAGLRLQPKSSFVAERTPIIRSYELRPFPEVKERIELSEGNPERIVCRCEQISEQVIVDALRRGIPITSLDGVKRRTRAGMGPCQGQFCGPRVRSLVAKEAGISEEQVTSRGAGSGPLPERVSTKTLRKFDV